MFDKTSFQAYRKTHEAFFNRANGGNDDSTETQQGRRTEELKETPVFSGDVLGEVLDCVPQSGQVFANNILRQYGLLAKIIQRNPVHDDQEVSQDFAASVTEAEQDIHLPNRRLFANINTPWSAFICGSQGSGKSNTLSCLLEAGLLQETELGVLEKPLTALVFHYDSFSSKHSQSICEAAYLASHRGLKVKIYVAADNYSSLKDAYHEHLHHLGEREPTVTPLYFEDKQLSVGRMRKLMSTEDGGKSILYMEVMGRVLRAMALEDQRMEGVNYKEFLRRLTLEKFNGAQADGIGQRLGLLEAFLRTEEMASEKIKNSGSNNSSSEYLSRETDRQNQITRDRKIKRQLYRDNKLSFEPGTLNIVDLSSQHIDPEDACMLFNIALEVFLQEVGHSGSIIALDEAHKYMTGSGNSSAFTESLLSVIRQQRHLATRVLIATQEPTISSSLLDLCSMTIVHRFTSPQWMEALKGHLAGTRRKVDKQDDISEKLFDSIVNLEKGEALLFSPSAMLDVCPQARSGSKVKKLGAGCVKILVRPTLTEDGGQSINALTT